MSTTVIILMGSDSDLPRLEGCLQTLREFEIPFEARVMSAHRTPHDVVELVEGAADRGVGLFICAAGLAAHLAGVVAAHTHLPVLGIPMDNAPFNGLDSLMSTVQMPGGVPVATFGAGSGGPVNAAHFAARLLALSDPALADRVKAQRVAQAENVRAKDARLQEKLKA